MKECAQLEESQTSMPSASNCCLVAFAMAAFVVMSCCAQPLSPSPADMIMASPDTETAPPDEELHPSLQDLLPLLPVLDPIAQYVQAWHSLGHGAHQAARDLAHVLQSITQTMQLIAQRRQQVEDVLPWFLRIPMPRGIQM